MDSDLSLLMVDVQLSRDGAPLTPTNSTVALPTFIILYTQELDSFERSDSGNYTCTAVIRPQPTLAYLTESDLLSNTITITSGEP